MSGMVARAAQFTRTGFELGERGALYSARAEFLRALEVIAQCQDAQLEMAVYTKGLAAGMTALREANDFGARRSVTQEVDVAFLAESHRTPVLKGARAEGLTPMAAQGRYYTYAQEQLAAAAGMEPVGSMALYGLGKVTALMPSAGKLNQLECTGQAMACFQAALLCDPNNFRAAHELGVVLAQNGRLEQARDMFLRVVAISPNVATWQNLAVIHDRLGQRALASAARAEAKQSAGATAAGGNPAVHWVDARTFAQTTSPTDGLMPSSSSRQQGSAAPVNNSQTKPNNASARIPVGPAPRR